MGNQAINCPKENCNGVLEEGIRGFYKCTVCGTKVKKSLVAQMIESSISSAKPAKPVNKPIVEDKKSVIEQPIVVAETVNQPEDKLDTTSIVTEVLEKQQKKIAEHTAKTITADGVTLRGLTDKIICCDCGAERTVKIQDVFQVKRCLDCQKIYAKARRAERAKAKRAVANKK